jgi:DNA-binding NarL/FixJ family response regulator
MGMPVTSLRLLAEAIIARRLRERGGRLSRGPRANTRAKPSGLTARELEVLALLAGGLRNNEIVGRLFLSADYGRASGPAQRV